MDAPNVNFFFLNSPEIKKLPAPNFVFLEIIFPQKDIFRQAEI